MSVPYFADHVKSGSGLLEIARGQAGGRVGVGSGSGLLEIARGQAGGRVGV